MVRLVAILMTVFALGCSMGDGKNLRPSNGCECAKKMGEDKCRCGHCQNEYGAVCYCGTGGCKCGGVSNNCQCRHCKGYPGADDGEEHCRCGKAK